MFTFKIWVRANDTRETVQEHIDALNAILPLFRTRAEVSGEYIKEVKSLFGAAESEGLVRGKGQAPIKVNPEADARDHELHEGSPLKAPPFTPEEIALDEMDRLDKMAGDGALGPLAPLPPLPLEGASAAQEFPFVAAVGASSTSAPPVPPVPTLDSVKLDADGLPWDDRIHSSNHKFDAQGRWWKRRGVQEVTRKAVEAELKLLSPNEVREIQATPPAPSAPRVPAAPPVPPAPPQASFPRFVTAYMKLKLPAATCRQTLVEMGIEPPEFPTMAKHPDRWAEFASKVGMGWPA